MVALKCDFTRLMTENIGLIYVRLKPKPLATLIKFEVVEVEDTVLHSANTIGFTVGNLLTIFIAICFINFIIALLYLFDFAIGAQTEGFLTQCICCCKFVTKIFGAWTRFGGLCHPGPNVKPSLLLSNTAFGFTFSVTVVKLKTVISFRKQWYNAVTPRDGVIPVYTTSRRTKTMLISR